MARTAAGLLLGICLGVALLLGLGSGQARAQTPETYTVQPGDTLGEIATRFGIPLAELAAANNIADVNVLTAGQVLTLPGQGSAGSAVAARPGDTLPQVAARVGVPVSQLAALNSTTATARLFPGQPVRLPAGVAAQDRLAFGAVQAVAAPPAVVQGQASWLTLQASRPLSLSVLWNGVPLGVQPVLRQAEGPAVSSSVEEPTVWGGYVPIPALMGPGVFPLQVSYVARNGVAVSRTFPVQVQEGTFLSQQIILEEGKGGLLDQELVRAELAYLWSIWSQTDTPIQWRQPFRRPLPAEYPSTSPYGTRRSYNGGPYSSFHSGEDLGAPGGVTVTASADGVVVLAELLTVRGNSVMLDHGAGVFSGYWHLQEFLVQPGERVQAGQPIGLVGTTGLSTGNHLHWELRMYGLAVDPMQFLEKPLFPPLPPDGG